MSDSYKINILHFVNPHLIWVESIKNGNEKNELEQIGLFGVLPLLPQIDIVQNELISHRVDDWAPAITEIMKKILLDACEVTFETIFVDPNNSIFNNNVHIFGEIIIKKKDKTIIKFTEELNKSNFSIEDKPEFLAKLKAGKLRNKLTKQETDNIIKFISSTYKTRDNRKLVYLKKGRVDVDLDEEDAEAPSCSENLNTELTVDNLHKHNYLLENEVPTEEFDSSSMLLEEKLEMWKLADEKDRHEFSSEGSLEVVEQKAEQDPLEKSKLYLLKKLQEYKESKKRQNPKPQVIQEEKKLPEPVKIPKFIPKYDLKKRNRLAYQDSIPDQNTKSVNHVNNSDYRMKNNYEDMGYSSHDAENSRNEYERKHLDTKISPKNKVNNIKRLSDTNTPTRLNRLIDFKKEIKNDKTPPKTKPQIVDDDSDNETTISALRKILNLENSLATTPTAVDKVKKVPAVPTVNHVNVFQNVDTSILKFIDKIINPVLIVHSKSNIRVQPVLELQDVYFTEHILSNLSRNSIKQPMLLQTVSWPCILRGYSMFMISPAGSGKTLGYIPAVCRLVSDYDSSEGLGPVCIIICATAKSALSTEGKCKALLGRHRTVLSCFAGKDERETATMLINGCDVFVTTPCSLVRLLNVPNSVLDLKRLAIAVLDDCERLDGVYTNELKYFFLKVKEMSRNRLNKEQSVQYIVASRVWCSFMEGLAKKAPHSVVSISAFQESVVYSKAHTSVSFVDSSNKIKVVIDFLKEIDGSKRTVVVCRTNEEVHDVYNVLKESNYVVFAGDNNMTVEKLYNLYDDWNQYDVPFIGAILVCCDDNLTYLNITNASYLIHYALPSLFSTFCKRFSVLTDNYASIFNDAKTHVKIKVLVEETNSEQLPKILNFIKRCSSEIPEILDEFSSEIMIEKERHKAETFVPICDKLLSFGECANFWNCRERHSLFNEVDTPPEWMPTKGVINFVIISFHSADTYSARLISHFFNGKLTKYPQMHTTLSLKIDMHYMKDVNKIPHGVPKIGDICAVAITDNHYQRCQVVKVLSRHNNGNAKDVVIKLLDEEKWDRTSDTHLYYLPEKFKEYKTYIVQVKLSGLLPKDRDLTFSTLAKHDLTKLVENGDNMFMRGNVLLALGNTVVIDDLEVCQQISKLNEVVVRYNFKEELLANHAFVNENHLDKLRELCTKCNFKIREEKVEIVEEVTDQKLPEPRWAHLTEGDLNLVYFASAETPDKFFIRLEKFEDCLQILTKDIENYLKDNKPVNDVKLREYVIAQFPDDGVYNRARIDEIVDGTKVKCFFVDHGDWRYVRINNIYKITEKFINQLPFQAIECRLVGVKPSSNDWSEFSTNYFCDLCFVGTTDNLKELYVQYFMKEKAECTGGHKYGIVVVDTSSAKDVVINQVMLKANLAVVIENEIQYVENFITKSEENSAAEKESIPEIEEISTKEEKNTNFLKYLSKKPIRSVPLVDDDFDDDEWDLVFGSGGPSEMASFLGIKSQLPMLNRANVDADGDNTRCTSGLSSKSSFQLISTPIPTEELDSDDLPTSESTTSIRTYKPKLFWHQNRCNLIIKLEIVGVENYTLDIKADRLKFYTKVDDKIYDFDIEMYGVVDTDKCTHNLKGVNVCIKLKKLLKLKWPTLCKDNGKERWISYNPDSIDTSSEEAEDDSDFYNDVIKNIVKNDYFYDSDCESTVGFKDDSQHF